MKTTARELFAKRVQELCAERGWSQDDLAKATGLPSTYIDKIERAEENIGLDNMEKIAATFRMSVFELFQEREQQRLH